MQSGAAGVIDRTVTGRDDPRELPPRLGFARPPRHMYRRAACHHGRPKQKNRGN
jgi:hypothetical protein